MVGLMKRMMWVQLLKALRNDTPNVAGKPFEERSIVFVWGDAQVIEEGACNRQEIPVVL